MIRHKKLKFIKNASLWVVNGVFFSPLNGFYLLLERDRVQHQFYFNSYFY